MICSKFTSKLTGLRVLYFLPYVLNGPIHLILFQIFTISLQADILHNYSVLQGLLQICKVY